MLAGYGLMDTYATEDDEAIEAAPEKEFRREVLETAANLISGDRHKDYGCAHENFQRIADLWSPIIGQEITPAQVALCMTQLKVARLVTSPLHADSWIDAAGYIALGAEIALEPKLP